MNCELPNSWSYALFGEVFSGSKGNIDPSKFPEEVFQLFSIPAFDKGTYETLKGKEIGSSKQIVEAGNLIISKINPRISRVGIISGDIGMRQIASTEWISFQLPPNIVPEYPVYFLSTPRLTSYFASKVTGAGGSLQRINRKVVEGVEFPLPPKGEQKRIVNKIETCFEKIDATDEALKKAELFIGKYKEALLAKVFRGELIPQDPNDEPASQFIERIRTEREQADTGKKRTKKTDCIPIAEDEIPFDIPTSWEWVRIEDLFSVQTGATPKRDNELYYLNGKIPYVKTGSIQNCEIHNAEEFITELAVTETNVKVFPIDTILIAMYGEGKTRGQTGILKIEAGTNQACAALVNTQLGLELREYVLEWLKFRYSALRNKAEGGNQLNLNLDKVKKFVMPLPTANEVKILTKKMRAYQVEIEAIQTKIAKISLYIESEHASILNTAFQGNLVSQVESEGTGYQLLEEILVEKAKLEVVKTKQKSAKKKTKKKTGRKNHDVKTRLI